MIATSSRFVEAWYEKVIQTSIYYTKHQFVSK